MTPIKLLPLVASVFLSLNVTSRAETLQIEVQTLAGGYDGKQCWVQARAGAIPRKGSSPLIVVTMQKLLVTGSDVYSALSDIRSSDLGKTWTAPRLHEQTLGRREEPGGVQVVYCDTTPKWHAATRKLLSTGSTIRYLDDRGPMKEAARNVPYSVFDEATGEWAAWKPMELSPELAYCGAGCTQRVDLPSGDILLPVYFRPPEGKYTRVSVLKCRFDGTTLSMLEQGPPLVLDTKRGLAEPSLTRFQERWLLTVRHDDTGYVAESADGLHFGPLREWKWDDDTKLGTYNTQSHWVTHHDALYLTYTRRGANNDHVFRNRAPLFIAEVDLATLRIRRATEQVLLPERGARYGNFGVCDINESETWVVDTEWMQRPPEEKVIPVENKWGAAGRVLAARIHWSKPNEGWDKR